MGLAGGRGMRFFSKAPDGGVDSGVTGYFLFEIKWLFSIVLLRFEASKREVYHSHAFWGITWWLWGTIIEEVLHRRGEDGYGVETRVWMPSFKPKITSRDCIHRFRPVQYTVWALSIRGPWARTWIEVNPHTMHRRVLSHGRKILK